MENTPKKRGRKPKNYNNKETIVKKHVITPIITHLPISITENNTESNTESNTKSNIYSTGDINEKDKKIIELQNQIKVLKNKIKKKTCEKSVAYQVNYNEDSVCWWCKHNFDGPKIELPIRFYDDTFYTYGMFCSYECCEAYNIDLNDDNVFNRSSLLKFHYYKTFNEFKNIKKAKDWKILKPFGGNVNINDFRESFSDVNDYNYLKPPMISRYAHIEKINLLKNNSGNELVIKRSTPLKNSKNSLGKFIKSSNELL